MPYRGTGGAGGASQGGFGADSVAYSAQVASVSTFNNPTFSNQMVSLTEAVNVGGFTLDTDTTPDPDVVRIVIPEDGNYTITFAVNITASNAILTAQRYQIQARIRRSSDSTLTEPGLPAYGYAEGQYFTALSLADAVAETTLELSAGDLIWGEIASQRKGLGTATATVESTISLIKHQVGSRGPQGPAGPAGDSISALPAFDSTDAGQVLTVNAAGDDADWEDVDAAPTATEVKTLYESNANTNAFTDAYETKVNGIAAGAEVNVNADWDATSGDAEIENKPEVLPDSYGAPGQVLAVDNLATGSEWVNQMGGSGLPDSAAADAGRVLTVNDDGDDEDWGDLTVALTATIDEDTVTVTGVVTSVIPAGGASGQSSHQLDLPLATSAAAGITSAIDKDIQDSISPSAGIAGAHVATLTALSVVDPNVAPTLNTIGNPKFRPGNVGAFLPVQALDIWVSPGDASTVQSAAFVEVTNDSDAYTFGVSSVDVSVFNNDISRVEMHGRLVVPPIPDGIDDSLTTGTVDVTIFSSASMSLAIPAVGSEGSGVMGSGAFGTQGGTDGQLLAVNSGEDGVEWVDAADGTTNLAIANRDADSLEVTSSTGTDAEIPSATITQAGLISSADKVIVNNAALDRTGWDNNLATASETAQSVADTFDQYVPSDILEYEFGAAYAAHTIVRYQDVLYRSRVAIALSDEIPPLDPDNFAEITTHRLESYGEVADQQAAHFGFQDQTFAAQDSTQPAQDADADISNGRSDDVPQGIIQRTAGRNGYEAQVDDVVLFFDNDTSWNVPLTTQNASDTDAAVGSILFQVRVNDTGDFTTLYSGSINLAGGADGTFDIGMIAVGTDNERTYTLDTDETLEFIWSWNVGVGSIASSTVYNTDTDTPLQCKVSGIVEARHIIAHGTGTFEGMITATPSEGTEIAIIDLEGDDGPTYVGPVDETAIIPGTNGQVLSTVSGATAWADAAGGGGATSPPRSVRSPVANFGSLSGSNASIGFDLDEFTGRNLGDTWDDFDSMTVSTAHGNSPNYSTQFDIDIGAELSATDDVVSVRPHVGVNENYTITRTSDTIMTLARDGTGVDVRIGYMACQFFGTPGTVGPAGATGTDGADGTPGTDGATGADGAGVPTPLGTSGQVVTVNAGASAAEWADTQATNLTLTSSAELVVIGSSTGNSVSIPSATTSAAGAMGAADKTKIDGIEAGSEVNVQSDFNATTGDATILNKPAAVEYVPSLGNADQVLTVNTGETAAEWSDAPSGLPALGSAGQVLTVSDDATPVAEWADAAAEGAGFYMIQSMSGDRQSFNNSSSKTFTLGSAEFDNYTAGDDLDDFDVLMMTLAAATSDAYSTPYIIDIAREFSATNDTVTFNQSSSVTSVTVTRDSDTAFTLDGSASSQRYSGYAHLIRFGGPAGPAGADGAAGVAGDDGDDGEDGLGIPTPIGTAGQVVAVNSAANAAEWVDAPSGVTDLSLTQSANLVQVHSSTGNDVSIFPSSSSIAGVQTAADKSKLDGIEAGSTADQTDAEIKTAYENNSDTNAFTDDDEDKLDDITPFASMAGRETHAITFEIVSDTPDSENEILHATGNDLASLVVLVRNANSEVANARVIVIREELGGSIVSGKTGEFIVTSESTVAVGADHVRTTFTGYLSVETITEFGPLGTFSLGSVGNDVRLHFLAKEAVTAYVPNFGTADTPLGYDNEGALGEIDFPTELPAALGDAGQVLTVNVATDAVEWADNAGGEANRIGEFRIGQDYDAETVTRYQDALYRNPAPITDADTIPPISTDWVPLVSHRIEDFGEVKINAPSRVGFDNVNIAAQAAADAAENASNPLRVAPGLPQSLITLNDNGWLEARSDSVSVTFPSTDTTTVLALPSGTDAAIIGVVLQGGVDGAGWTNIKSGTAVFAVDQREATVPMTSSTDATFALDEGEELRFRYQYSVTTGSRGPGIIAPGLGRFTALVTGESGTEHWLGFDVNGNVRFHNSDDNSDTILIDASGTNGPTYLGPTDLSGLDDDLTASERSEIRLKIGAGAAEGELRPVVAYGSSMTPVTTWFNTSWENPATGLSITDINEGSFSILTLDGDQRVNIPSDGVYQVHVSCHAALNNMNENSRFELTMRLRHERGGTITTIGDEATNYSRGRRGGQDFTNLSVVATALVDLEQNDRVFFEIQSKRENSSTTGTINASVSIAQIGDTNVEGAGVLVALDNLDLSQDVGTWAGIDLASGNDNASGMAVNPSNGDVVVLDSAGDYFYTYSDGAWDSGTAIPSEENSPRGIDFDLDGNVNIVGISSDAVWVLEDGTWSNVFDLDSANALPYGLAINKTTGAYFVGDFSLVTPTLYYYAADGTYDSTGNVSFIGTGIRFSDIGFNVNDELLITSITAGRPALHLYRWDGTPGASDGTLYGNFPSPEDVTTGFASIAANRDGQVLYASSDTDELYTRTVTGWTIVLQASTPLTTYVANTPILFRAPLLTDIGGLADTTAPVNLNIDSVGLRELHNAGGQAVTGNLITGQYYLVVDNGTDFLLAPPDSTKSDTDLANVDADLTGTEKAVLSEKLGYSVTDLSNVDADLAETEKAAIAEKLGYSVLGPFMASDEDDDSVVTPTWDSGTAIAQPAVSTTSVGVKSNGDLVISSNSTSGEGSEYFIFTLEDGAWVEGATSPGGSTVVDGLTVNDDDEAVILQTGNIYTYTGDAWVQNTSGPSGATDTAGVAIDGDGNFVVADSGTNQIFTRVDGTWDSGVAGPSGANDLQGIAFTPEGLLTVVDNTTDLIYTFVDGAWDDGFALPSGVTSPVGLAIDADLNYYLATILTIYEGQIVHRIAVNATPTLQAYSAGLAIRFLSPATSRERVVLNVDGVGDVQLHNATRQLHESDLLNGVWYLAVHDGTNFVLVTDPNKLDVNLGNVADLTSAEQTAFQTSIGAVSVDVQQFPLVLGDPGQLITVNADGDEVEWDNAHSIHGFASVLSTLSRGLNFGTLAVPASPSGSLAGEYSCPLDTIDPSALGNIVRLNDDGWLEAIVDDVVVVFNSGDTATVVIAASGTEAATVSFSIQAGVNGTDWTTFANGLGVMAADVSEIILTVTYLTTLTANLDAGDTLEFRCFYTGAVSGSRDAGTVSQGTVPFPVSITGTGDTENILRFNTSGDIEAYNTLLDTDTEIINVSDVGGLPTYVGPVDETAILPGTNGQVLSTVSGATAWVDDDDELPGSLGDAGQVLTVNSGATAVAWADPTVASVVFESSPTTYSHAGDTPWANAMTSLISNARINEGGFTSETISGANRIIIPEDGAYVLGMAVSGNANNDDDVDAQIVMKSRFRSIRGATQESPGRDASVTVLGRFGSEFSIGGVVNTATVTFDAGDRVWFENRTDFRDQSNTVAYVADVSIFKIPGSSGR